MVNAAVSIAYSPNPPNNSSFSVVRLLVVVVIFETMISLGITSTSLAQIFCAHNNGRFLVHVSSAVLLIVPSDPTVRSFHAPDDSIPATNSDSFDSHPVLTRQNR